VCIIIIHWCKIVPLITNAVGLRRLRSQRENRIDVRFRTDTDSGVLLIQSKGPDVRDDYLVIAVVDGKVEVSYNLGKQSSRSLFFLKSPTLVSDGLWHVAVLDR